MKGLGRDWGETFDFSLYDFNLGHGRYLYPNVQGKIHLDHRICLVLDFITISYFSFCPSSISGRLHRALSLGRTHLKCHELLHT